MGRSTVAATIMRHPREFVGVLMAAGATLTILVNALFLQHGPHPAPIFATRSFIAPAAQPSGHKGDRLAPPRATAPQGALTPARQDPIAELIAPSKPRLLAIQHALADFGYGQIKPTGTLDRETRAAIEKFEREHSLPAEGEVTDRFVRELAAMTGRPLEQ
jgi:putative peptidoglycan binding protein